MIGGAKRVDSNQAAIVETFRSVGATVQHLHVIGRGCPDILVGFRGVNYLVEIKDGSKPPSKRQLTPDEIEWHRLWRGQISIVKNNDDALRLIGAI